MIWQDLLFMIGGFIFAPSLVLTIRSVSKPNKWTSLLTAVVLTSYLVAYFTMGFWLAATSTALTAICWYVLFFQVRRQK